MTCRVQGCRHPTTHTTIAHRCGNCREFGHGQIECNNDSMKEKLCLFFSDRINFLRRCEVPNCPNSETHHTTAHHCSKCGQRHQEDNCIIQTLDYYRNRFSDDDVQYFDEIKFLDENIHRNAIVPIQLGLGCRLFIRVKDGVLTSLFMDFDSWGQYGESQDIQVYRNYIENSNIMNVNSYCNIPELENPTRNIECPLCRTVNKESQISKVYGLEIKCSLCMDDNVNRFFQECGHACICHNCLDKLN